ncbi:hypothetical protein DFH09DRAFT_1360900, partial [Mycena vulgaris]
RHCRPLCALAWPWCLFYGRHGARSPSRSLCALLRVLHATQSAFSSQVRRCPPPRGLAVVSRQACQFVNIHNSPALFCNLCAEGSISPLLGCRCSWIDCSLPHINARLDPQSLSSHLNPNLDSSHSPSPEHANSFAPRLCIIRRGRRAVLLPRLRRLPHVWGASRSALGRCRLADPPPRSGSTCCRGQRTRTPRRSHRFPLHVVHIGGVYRRRLAPSNHPLRILHACVLFL